MTEKQIQDTQFVFDILQIYLKKYGTSNRITFTIDSDGYCNFTDINKEKNYPSYIEWRDGSNRFLILGRESEVSHE